MIGILYERLKKKELMIRPDLNRSNFEYWFSPIGSEQIEAANFGLLFDGSGLQKSPELLRLASDSLV